MPIAPANIWPSAASHCRACSSGVSAGRALGRLAILASAPLFVAPSLAQVAAGGAPTREEINRAAPPPQSSTPSRLTIDDERGRAPCPLADPAAPSMAIAFAGARFEHLQGLTADRLRPAFEAFLGKTIGGGPLCEIRDAATAILARAGYVAAIEIPPQDGADGIVRFDVVMARIVRIELAGGSTRMARPLAAYLARIRAEPVFNLRTAERYLLLARDLPGYDVHLTLRSAGAAPGEVVGIVSLARTPIAISANLQNYGSHELGRWGALVSAQINGVAGLGDRLTLGLFNSLQPREQTVLQAGYDLRLGSKGWAVGARVTQAWTHPTIADTMLTSRTLIAALDASVPLVRRQATTVRATGGIELIDQDLRQDGTLATRDRLRAAFLRLDLEARERPAGDIFAISTALPRWRLAGTFEARRGLGILGASPSCGAAPLFSECTTLPTRSRLQADPTATLVRFTGYGEVRPLGRVTLVASPRLQYAFDPLAGYEQYSGGAYTVGRGYDPGAAIGDSGAGLSIEAQYGSIAPRHRGAAFQPFLFVDGAWVWSRASYPPEDDPLRLLSTGGGIRVALADRARVELTAAIPLRRGPYQTERGGTRVLLSITTRLWP